MPTIARTEGFLPLLLNRWRLQIFRAILRERRQKMQDLELESLFRELGELQKKAQAGIALIPDAKFLANFVQLERCSMGWKQETLASFAEVSLSTVQRIERGDSVSAACLDKIALALGQKPGAFTEPRVPLTTEEFGKKVKEWTRPFRDLSPVNVQPLRKQTQIIRLTRAEFCLVERGQLDEQYQDEIDGLREALGCVAFILGSQEANSVIKFADQESCKRRELYNSILDYVSRIQREANAVALAGVYAAATNHPALAEARVGLIAFFPRRTDPGAIKRRVLFAPKSIDVQQAWKTFLTEPVHVYRMGSP
jgi:transcriptional regulator with XRE-family HTH domain